MVAESKDGHSKGLSRKTSSIKTSKPLSYVYARKFIKKGPVKGSKVIYVVSGNRDYKYLAKLLNYGVAGSYVLDDKTKKV